MIFPDQVPDPSSCEVAEMLLGLQGGTTRQDSLRRIAQLAVELVGCVGVDIVRVSAGGRLRVLTSSDPALSESACDAIFVEFLIPLRLADQDHGQLRFLFDQRTASGTGGRTDIRMLHTFAAHAALTLDRLALVQQVEGLRSALDSNREIGAAVGILMAREHLTYPQGLARLTGASQNGNRKMREVASDVVHTGELAPAGRPAA